MSYDLMVFDPKAPPRDRKGFINWYKKQVSWSEEHDYSNPDVTTPKLLSWFLEMKGKYPHISDTKIIINIFNPRLTEYSIGKSFIYACFKWSEMENARKMMFELAKKHSVGFFDVSAQEGQVWIPDDNGEYRCIHGSR